MPPPIASSSSIFRIDPIVKTFLYNFAALWNLLLFFGTGAVLVWFVYWFLLRRLWRARKIAGARDRRMLREAAERETERAHGNGL